jgi:hypothetical protein
MKDTMHGMEGEERRGGNKKLIDYVKKIASITRFENKTIEKRKL